MKDVKRKLLAIFLILTMLLTLVGSAVAEGGGGNPGEASGKGVRPEYVDGNPDADNLGISGNSYKIDAAPQNGTYYDEHGTLIVKITNANGNHFDWTANIPVKAIIVKGGNCANVYRYNPNKESDTGLHAPMNPSSGKVYGLSHVTFIYDTQIESGKGFLLVKNVVLNSRGHIDWRNKEEFTFVATNQATQEQQTFSISSTQEQQIFTIRGNGRDIKKVPAGTYTIKEINIPEGYKPFKSTKVVKVKEHLTTLVIFINRKDVVPPSEGTLTIEKRVEASDGNLIEDDTTEFTFAVLNGEGESVQTPTIIGNGSTDLTLPAGDYTVTETNIPEEFEQDVSVQTATLASGGTAAVTFTNKLKAEPPTTGTLTINKTVVNSFNEEINDDTEFTFSITPIFRSSASPSSITVKGGSSETINLPAGEFSIAEENIPEAYENDVEAQFVIIENGYSKSLTFTNKLKAEPITTGTLTITKVVRDSEGAVQEDDNTAFQFAISPAAVRPMSSTPVQQEVTVNAGSSNTVELPAGDYLVKEVNIPDGYEHEVEAQEVSIIAGEEHCLTFNNTLLDEIEETNGALTLTKRVVDRDGSVLDEDDGLFAFVLTNNDTKEVQNVKIEGNGKEIITLLAGSYTIKEIRIPEDYVQDIAAQTVEIKADENSTVTFTNEKLEEIIIDPPPAGGDGEEGTLTINKRVIDGDDELLTADEGLFTFVITDNNTKKEQTVTINGNGKKAITLLAGSYTIKEIRIPEDYVQDIAAQIVEIKADENSTITFTNEKLEEIIVEPEDPSGNDEDKDEDEKEKELPKTNAADLWMLGFGFLVTTSGWTLRRKRK
ncbi:MAG TPA: SpaA isopeptide-forming pilin-related protein [Oscillospiraceae bacterium]|nr:SpaA isopeptide-forming pilin-related protein [Oscillospiraceae bacterium]